MKIIGSILALFFLFNTINLMADDNIYISNIELKRNDPFLPEEKPLGWLEKTGNSLHYTTRPLIIRSELLFSANSNTTLDLIQ